MGRKHNWQLKKKGPRYGPQKIKMSVYNDILAQYGQLKVSPIVEI